MKTLKSFHWEDVGGGTLTNDTFTIKCYPVSDPDCIFKA